jgi:hypothetical protein
MLPLSHPPLALAQPHISPTQSPSPLTQPPAIEQPRTAPKQLTNCQTYQCLHYGNIISYATDTATHIANTLTLATDTATGDSTAPHGAEITHQHQMYQCLRYGKLQSTHIPPAPAQPLSATCTCSPSAEQPPAQPPATSATYAGNICTGHNAPCCLPIHTHQCRHCTADVVPT